MLLFVGVCGLVNAETLTMQPRIYGGTAAKNSSYPDYVLIRVIGDSTCGGTVISAKWVLTAAHCVTYERNNKVALPQNIKVYIAPELKKDFLSDSTIILFDKKIYAKNVIRHFGYDSTSSSNDIALIELQESASVVPTVLNDSSAGLVGSNAKIVGLGEDFFGDVISKRKIQVATVPVVDSQVCKNAYWGGVPDTVICAGKWGYSWQTSSGPCSGDSGGPLYIEKSGTRIQAGVTSFGPASNCGRAYPSGYTDISQYKAWITQYSSPMFYSSSVSVDFMDSFE